MNRKFEDKLVRLAFGETGTRESASLERKVQSDPEAARALQEYQDLKSGLNLLTEVPPDQFSKERLRDAILGQGLKPLPVDNHVGSPARWGWAWMPLSAAALALAWLGIRHKPATEARVVASAPEVATAFKVSPNWAVPNLGHAVKQPKAAPIEHAGEDRAAHLVVKRHAIEPALKPILAVNPLIQKTKPAVVASNAKPKTPSVPSPTTAADASDSGARLVSTGPLVVINPEHDNNSGAQKATEVDGASDFGPVGG